MGVVRCSFGVAIAEKKFNSAFAVVAVDERVIT